MPGYTHLQIAMPSSFGLWFGALRRVTDRRYAVFAGSIQDDNRNPLGSAAGYGSSFPLNRQMTTDLLGFDSMDYNVVYAQMGRGKMERNVAFSIAGLQGQWRNWPSTPACSTRQNFQFVKLPKECTTGSTSCAQEEPGRF